MIFPIPAHPTQATTIKRPWSCIIILDSLYTPPTVFKDTGDAVDALN